MTRHWKSRETSRTRSGSHSTKFLTPTEDALSATAERIIGKVQTLKNRRPNALSLVEQILDKLLDGHRHDDQSQAEKNDDAARDDGGDDDSGEGDSHG